MSVTANKPIDLALLKAQLAAAGITVEALGKAGLLVHTYNAQGQALDLPPAAQAVVDAHDYTQGAAYQAEQSDIATFTDWASAIENMLAVAAADKAEIVTDLTTLNASTWDSLSAAQRTAAIRRLATRQQHILTGLERLLKAVAVLERRQGG